MCEKQFNIIAMWSISICSIGLYLYTNNIYISTAIVALASPLRNNLYVDNSLSSAINKYPVAGFIAALLSLIWSGVIVYKGNTNPDKTFTNVISFNDCVMVFIPILFLYLYCDIKLYISLKKK
jgi:hypothetical protein